MWLALQFVGAIATLIPFVLMRLNRLERRDFSYLILNFIGAALLTADAWRGSQWGFVILQTVWALVTAWGLAQRLRQMRRVDKAAASEWRRP